MKPFNPFYVLIVFGLLFGHTAGAATMWIGADGADLTTSTNWNSGVPSLVNEGEIPVGTLGINFNSSVTDWIVTQEAGVVSTTSFRQFNGGSWTMNGGSMDLGNNFQLVTSDNRNHVFTVNTGASASTNQQLIVSSTGTNRTATLNIDGGTVSTNNNLVVNNGGTVNFYSGNVSVASNRALSVNAGGQITMTNGTLNTGSVSNSGTLNIANGNFSTDPGRNFATNAGGITTISGGNISVGSNIGDSIRGSGAFVFEGGTTTLAGDIRADAATFSLTMAGTASGSLTGDTWHVSTTHRHMDWLSGTLMAVTLSGDNTWAETEWAADRMFFNGQSGSDLGLTWADVINPSIGFDSGGGTYFNWQGMTNTLSLVTIPEPATLGLLTLGGLAWLSRCRTITTTTTT